MFSIPDSFSCSICLSMRISPFTRNKPLGFSYVNGAKRSDFPAASIIAFFILPSPYQRFYFEH